MSRMRWEENSTMHVAENAQLNARGAATRINPCAAVGIFHSFEAGIASAISSFKWMKNYIIYEK